MDDPTYTRLKRQKGETFAQTIRNHHSGILEIPDLDLIVRHAGKDAEPLLPYLKSLLSSNDDAPVAETRDPFVLLEEAGYDAFYADTLEKQNGIEHYFTPDELLCTFNDASRYIDFHIVHAVKRGAASLKRTDFNGTEDRQDPYGTSVISIQISKKGGFIKITNRYNHAVSHGDNTFGSNPNKIAPGLSRSLKNYFNVDFSIPAAPLPEGFVSVGNQVFKYHTERNNVYYGDQAWVQNGTIHAVDRSRGDALFDGFLFDNKTKTLKSVDSRYMDSFAEDFNRAYGGNPGLFVRKGNLMLNDEILIGAEESRMNTLYLPEVTTMGDDCLHHAQFLTHFVAPMLETVGVSFLGKARALEHFSASVLKTAGNGFLRNAVALRCFDVPMLTVMGNCCLEGALVLTHLEVPALVRMGCYCLENVPALRHFSAPALTGMGQECLSRAPALERVDIPALTEAGFDCLTHSPMLSWDLMPPVLAM